MKKIIIIISLLFSLSFTLFAQVGGEIETTQEGQRYEGERNLGDDPFITAGSLYGVRLYLGASTGSLSYYYDYNGFSSKAGFAWKIGFEGTLYLSKVFGFNYELGVSSVGAGYTYGSTERWGRYYYFIAKIGAGFRISLFFINVGINSMLKLSGKTGMDVDGSEVYSETDSSAPFSVIGGYINFGYRIKLSRTLAMPVGFEFTGSWTNITRDDWDYWIHGFTFQLFIGIEF